jgi:DNA invertase Pin-like site-specific DNA recombinase
MKRAVAYYRVSTPQQAEKESIDLQKFTHQDFFKDKEYELVAEFEDDGISGESIDKRPGFRKALARLRKRDIDVLVVYMVDRIGRFKRRRDRNKVIELLEESQTHVHASEEDVIFHWNKEKEINDLEYELNDSRRENVRRGRRIHKGHAAKRLKGGFSGGQLPYGIAFDHKQSTFSEVPAEVETLKTIFEKLKGGWGLQRVRDYLNENLEIYPKRKRKYNGKLVTDWSAENIRAMVLSDFYFTGIVDRTPKSILKGIPPVTTDIKLFDEAVVKAARFEMSVRRIRGIDRKLANRQRIHSQQDKTVFTDALLHGIVRCGHCGWRLGIQRVRKGPYDYLYYVCRGRNKGKCSLKNIRAGVLNLNVWEQFVSTLDDPEKLEQMILDQNFIIDERMEQKRAEYAKAQNDFKKISGVIERVKNLYKWEDISKDKYKEDLKNYGRLLNEAQDRANNLKQIINQPKAVQQSVKKATRYVADQLMAIWILGKLGKTLQSVKELVASTEDIAPGDSEQMKTEKAYFKLKAMKLQLKAYEIADKVMDELRQTRKTPSTEERKNLDIKLLTYQQKRLMLQMFIDTSPDKSIRVFDAQNFDLNLYIRSNLFNDFGDEKRKNKQSDREKYFKRNQFGPVTRSPNLF